MKPKRILVSLAFPLLLISQITAQSGSESEYDSISYMIPGPEPFTIDESSAKYCIGLLRRSPFLEVKDESGKTGIIKVNTVWSHFQGVDESYPEGHQLRYDIVVNGQPLDWDNSFIEYGGDMINLRLLFLYRNQHPPENLEYLNNP